MSDIYDGFISRHINRRLSEPVAGLLARTRVTPNQVTWGSFTIAIASFASFVIGLNVLGGILAQVSSVADGVDGGLARRKNMATAFGGFLDAVLDRYADGLIVLGMVLWATANETRPAIWIAGFAAIIGTLVVSYSRARIAPEHRSSFDRGLASLSSRDIRLFLIMLGSIAGQVYFTLIFLGVLTNGMVLYRLAYTYQLSRMSAGTPEAGVEPSPDAQKVGSPGKGII